MRNPNHCRGNVVTQPSWLMKAPRFYTGPKAGAVDDVVIDQVAIDRLLGGDDAVLEQLTKHEKREAARQAVARYGWDWRELGERLRMNSQQLRDALEESLPAVDGPIAYDLTELALVI